MFADKPPRKRTYLWRRPDWPQWRYDAAALAGPLAQLHRAQGELVGRMAHLGLAQRDLATLQVLAQEVITTSAIEGETLNLEAVRSSIARRINSTARVRSKGLGKYSKAPPWKAETALSRSE